MGKRVGEYTFLLRRKLPTTATVVHETGSLHQIKGRLVERLLQRPLGFFGSLLPDLLKLVPGRAGILPVPSVAYARMC